jgi:lysophospholipase L1-like esterase
VKRLALIAGVNAAVLAVGVVILELIFGGWLGGGDPLFDFSRPRNVKWSFAVPWRPDGALYSRDAYGLRGLDGEPSDVFILTMGGSTTDQRYLADEETWQEALQRRLNGSGGSFDVVNAGIDGQSSVGHIKNFSQWINRIPGLQARYVLFYLGINDFYISADNRYDSDLAKRSLSKLANKSAIVSAFRVAREALRGTSADDAVDRRPGHSFGGIDASTYVAERKLASCCADPTVVEAVAALGERVAVLARLARDFGAEPIFVTQRSALWYARDGKVFGAPALQYGHPSILKNLGTITGADRHDLEAYQAEAIMAACRAADATCIDLFAEIEFDIEQDFYDDLHTTPAGAERIARFLARKLKQRLLAKQAVGNGWTSDISRP